MSGEFHCCQTTGMKRLKFKLAIGFEAVFLFTAFFFRPATLAHDYATVVITDSGSIQEETTYLGIPCLTLRSCAGWRRAHP